MVRVLKDLRVSYSLLEVGDFEVSHANVKAHCIDMGVIVFSSNAEKLLFYRCM